MKHTNVWKVNKISTTKNAINTNNNLNRAHAAASELAEPRQQLFLVYLLTAQPESFWQFWDVKSSRDIGKRGKYKQKGYAIYEHRTSGPWGSLQYTARYTGTCISHQLTAPLLFRFIAPSSLSSTTVSGFCLSAAARTAPTLEAPDL